MELMNEKPESGTLALFESPDELVQAIRKTRSLQITKLEAFTPFPIHEVIEALGIKRSWIPWGTLVMALTGMILGFGFQSWTMAVSWPLNIAGKPYISIPAFVPITFELTILIGGISTVLLLFLNCRLPNRKKAVLDLRLTDDLFGLYVEKEDPRFDEVELSKIFKECHAKEIKHF